MISKVKSVQPSGTDNTPHGLLFKFEYQMEDGAVLSARHKSQDALFAPGTEVEYEIKGTTDYGNYGSVSKPKDQSYNGQRSPQKKTTGGNASFALSYAKDVFIAGKITQEELIPLAEKFNNWLNQH